MSQIAEKLASMFGVSTDDFRKIGQSYNTQDYDKFLNHVKGVMEEQEQTVQKQIEFLKSHHINDEKAILAFISEVLTPRKP
ncbi:MAG: hypothetical protein AB7F43_14630 [Bacteriovoracia bacterium]